MRSLTDLPVEGSIVALRCDFNVPLDSNGVITDDLRIQAAIPTILALTARQARVVILAHLGRPKGQVVASMSLNPVAQRLAELTGKSVGIITDTNPASIYDGVNQLPPGSVTLLENVRFDPRETSKVRADRVALANEWAQWAQYFVADGFGVVHRSQASVTEIAELLPNAAGLLVQKETQIFNTLLHDAARPYTVVLGGSKVSDKLGVIDSLLPRVNNLLIGGGMAFTFLLAKQLSVGNSLQEPDFVFAVREFMEKANKLGVNLMLPVDFVVAQEFAPDSATQVVDFDQIPDGWMGLDIGPTTREQFATVINQSKTVVWNGPMGVFEMPAFSQGTLDIAIAMSQSGAFTVIGGGDSAAAVRLLKVDPTKFDHISTGGGASLEFLEGKSLPGLEILEGN